MPDNGYRFAPLAESDLEDIWLYTFRRWSRAQADSYHRNLVATFEDLALGRRQGRRADIRQGYLKYSAGAHVIYYRQQPDGLVVIRILHGSMEPNRHL